MRLQSLRAQPAACSLCWPPQSTVVDGLKGHPEPSQTISVLGGFRPQAQSAASALSVLRDAKASLLSLPWFPLSFCFFELSFCFSELSVYSAHTAKFSCALGTWHMALQGGCQCCAVMPGLLPALQRRGSGRSAQQAHSSWHADTRCTCGVCDAPSSAHCRPSSGRAASRLCWSACRRRWRRR